MSRTTIVIGVVFLLLSFYGMFQVKYKVQNLKRDLAESNRQLKENIEELHVLRAEWEYLNNPERIEKLAKKYLGKNEMNLSNLYTIDQLSRAFGEQSDRRFVVYPKPRPEVVRVAR